MSDLFADKCGTCRFFLLSPLDPFKGTGGMCRRRAPQGPVIKPPEAGWSIFPPMNTSQWCGEYERDHDLVERMQAEIDLRAAAA